jgi:transcriptional regulator with XRE-family HTH domain
MAKPSPTYAGKVIRELRLELEYSQEAFADEVGIDRSYVGGIERGEHNLALMNLMKIAKTLNLSGSQLLGKAKL